MDNAMQKMMLWVFLVIGSPVLVNAIMIWQNNMGFSKLAQGATGVVWLCLMGALMIRKKD